MLARATLTALICVAPAPALAGPAVGCGAGLPGRICAALGAAAGARTDGPRLVAGPGQGRAAGSWHLAVTTSIYDPVDDVTSADLRAVWKGTAAGPLARRRLAAGAEARALLTALWGAPDRRVVKLRSGRRARPRQTWSVIPFDLLNPSRKVLRVDGVSPLARGKQARGYPLAVPLRVVGASGRAGALRTLSNRREDRMTVLVMTGVTALTRKTARLMAARGVDYPARDIKGWFSDADFVHVSNEVSFKPGCPVTPKTMSFCSDPSYIRTLEQIRVNIVEITGNHISDKGRRWLAHSLKMYGKRGWRWFGGGANLEQARQPLKLNHNGNQLALVGCNLAGPRRAWATADAPGSRRCNLRQMRNEIRALRKEGYLPVATMQHVEKSTHTPLPMHVRHLRSLARAGAVAVQGSQAHQIKPMEFFRGGFIAYGLGNLFFDQVWNVNIRQMMVHRLVFHDRRLLSVEVLTGLNEEYGKPRPATRAQRRRLLRKLERVARKQRLHRPVTMSPRP